MPNTAILFSGQGSQFIGMGKDLHDALPAVRAIYQCAGDILGLDVAGISFGGDEAELARTAVTQPLVYTLSIAAWEAAKEYFPAPACVAGHSLGEYAALYAAGAFSLEDGFRLIAIRGRVMEEAANACSGAMCAVMKVDEEAVQTACDETDGLVMAVNFNNPGQTVIAGETAAVEAAAALLKERGARTAMLGVASAFHTPLMQPAADQFQQAIGGISFRPTTIPFYSNVTGDVLQIGDYPAYLARHMTSPVLFSTQIGKMVENGVDSCVEFGPKKTVATMAKKTCKELTVTSVEDLKSLQALPDFLQKLTAPKEA